jgi:hypothetical protein
MALYTMALLVIGCRVSQAIMFSYFSPNDLSTFIETIICEIASMIFLFILLLNIIEYRVMFKKLISEDTENEKK